MSNYDKLVKCIEENNISAEELLSVLFDWHGSDIISDEFMENLRDCEGWDV